MSMSELILNWKRAGMEDAQIRSMLIEICDKNRLRLKWILENHPKVVEEYVLTTIFIEDKWID
jgi:hypothetical protein